MVLTCEAHKFIAGRVRRFLTHTAPGVAPDADLEAIIADVEWYGTVADKHQGAISSSKALGCPIFKSSFVDDKRGKFWPVDKLAPCMSLAVRHKSGARASGSDRVSNHVVVLSSFGWFMAEPPHVE